VNGVALCAAVAADLDGDLSRVLPPDPAGPPRAA